MIKEKFIGTWNLIAVETVYANGERIPTFKNPQGILIYEANDVVALQISGEYTDKVLNKSTLPMTDESKKNIPTFRAYWGKYKIDEEKQTISHHILGGSEHISSPQEEREFVFKDEYLILQMKDKPWLPNGSAVQVTWRKWH